MLDEPLSNLDTKLRVEMRGEIRRICKEAGLTAIYVTHDQKEALSVGDRIAVMESGHIRQAGPPAEVYRRPLTRFVADFMGETNFVEGTVASAVGTVVKVDTALRQFTATAQGWQPSTGERVTLSMRPEAWRLGAESSAPNTINGKIRERVYLGEMAQYRFGSGASILKIYELNPRFVFETDDRELTASIEPDDVVVLRE